MPVPYNVTDIFNNTTTTFPDIAEAVNTASGDILGVGLLFAIFIIFAIINIGLNQKIPTAVGVAAIITAISSVFLARTGILSGEFVPVVVVLAVISLAWLWWTKGTEASY